MAATECIMWLWLGFWLSSSLLATTVVFLFHLQRFKKHWWYFRSHRRGTCMEREANIDRYPLMPFVYGIEKSSHLQIPFLKLSTSNVSRHCWILLQKADCEFLVLCSVCEDWGPGLSNDHRTLGRNGFGHANCQQWLGVHQIICNWAHTEVHGLGSWTGWDDYAFRYKSISLLFLQDGSIPSIKLTKYNWSTIICENRLLGVL